ncbi:MAG: TonB-dependent receptor, partial [Syntrophobacteraceae bacterium]
DPTPWFYGAIQKETQNRPVEALDQLEQSIRLNDNRAVYRSRLMLDQDLAAKSASLARIYQDLGFDRRALVEGWKSLNADPSNHSAHRFLSDAYATMPRHDIARVSELLQSQLLQPLNVNPVQPLMGEKNLFLPTVSGPANTSFNEYNALFTRNRADLLLSGSAGEHGSLADEVIVSGLYGKYSASLGQFHYETDGTWNNGDIRRNLYNAFVQAMVTPNLSLLAEYRNSNFLSGELSRVFSPAADYGTRESRDADSARFGMRASLSPQSDLIAHFSYCDFEDDIHYPKLFDIRGLNGYSAYNAEAQYLYRSERFNATVGGGTMWISNDSTTSMVFDKVYTSSEKRHINNSIGYLYTNINWPGDFTWTLGLSGNAAHGVKPGVDRDQVNPKLGLTWHPFPGTTVRSAVFRTLVGPGVSPGIFSGETIEPTQVAGFNQYFDDAEGTRSWRYGVGIDQKFGSHFFGGVEFSQRDEEVLTESDNQIIDFNVKEKLARAYLYWTPHPWISLGPEYQFERIETPENLSINSMCELNTHRLILGASFFHPCGFFAQAKPTLVFQEGRFLEKVLPYPHPSQYSRDHSDFFVLDAVIGYRLPRRLGFISIEARNLFDRSFRYQEIDPFSTSFYPQRWILGRVTLFF